MSDRYLEYASEVVPAKPEAERFAAALVAFLEADTALLKAKKAVPDYTGQHSSADYVATEQEARNRALDGLYEVAREVFR